MKVLKTDAGAGRTVLIQVADEPEIINAKGTGGGAAGFSPQEMLARLDDVSQTITDMSKALFDKVSSNFGKNRPQEFAIEFGVTLGGEAGVPLVTKGTVEAAFKVTATWKSAGEAPTNA